MQIFAQSPKAQPLSTKYQKFMEKVETPIISANWATNQNSLSSFDDDETPDAVIKIEEGF